jgi:hypothetical protein
LLPNKIKGGEKEMRKMLSAALLMCIVALLTLLIPAGYAMKPQDVKGTFDYTYEIIETRVADGNMFLYATEDETWIGDFAGTSEAVFRVEIFSAGFWNVWLRSTFTGEVDGKSGTMVIQLVGKRTWWDAERFWWYGQWVILSGTGELANLHGRGTWWGPGYEGEEIPGERPDIHYEGQIHFKPD